ncbi:MAG TPA: hypothetical protein VF761_16875 [Gemmatimonadaceae bacterium]
MSYDRTYVPEPGTKYTAAQARELAAMLEGDEKRQDGEGRDIIYIGNGETDVLIATLWDYAARVEAAEAKRRREIEAKQAAERGIVIESMTVVEGLVTEMDLELPVDHLPDLTEMVNRGGLALPGARGIVFALVDSPQLRSYGRVGVSLVINHIFMKGHP